MLKIVTVICVAWLGLTAGSWLRAQENVKVPTLTEVQKLQIQNLSHKLEIAQLRAQLAQKDFDAARTEIAALVETWQVKGYTLDLTTLTYQPEKAAK